MKFEQMAFLPAEEDVELIPLMNEEEENKLYNQDIPEEIAILPVKNTVLFPGVVIPINAGRDKSIQLLKEAQKANVFIGVVSQNDNSQDDPSPEHLYSIGTVARIIRLLKMPDGNLTVVLQGVQRFQWNEIIQTEPYYKAKVDVIRDQSPKKNDKEFSVVIESIKEVSTQIINENPAIPSEAVYAIKNIESPSLLVNFVSSNMNLTVSEKQDLLKIYDLTKRSLETLRFLDLELQKLELKNEVQSKVRTDIDKQQREYFLQQQMKAIQEELGGFSYEKETQDFEVRAKKKKWDKEIAERFQKELQRFQRLNNQSPEYSLQRNYLDFLLDLPWSEYTNDKFDLKRAERILNKHHFGLEKVKERILEYLAVLKLRQDMKSPIICLYGPPGVGKTSFGKSIADALGRKYARISLGGMHDESEIRGHRKTYIGAMPGRIIQSLKRVQSSNPVFVLDEIDKLGSSAHGDPASAMLEVLDPEQNTSFYDNYLELGYDLSKVMFIATANNLSSIHPALLDRMEIVDINGYTIEEKVEIAKRHLIPKQLKDHGLEKEQLKLGKKQLETLIEGYTRESGVRGLDKVIAKVVRNRAKNIVLEKEQSPILDLKDVREIMGPAKSKDKYETNRPPGVVTGLAWTRVGGDILFIESILSKGKGNLSITGNLGKVMKESANIALEYIKAHYDSFGIEPKLFETQNIHIHVPEGAVPKDGPSAGITMLTSLVSTLTRRQVKSKVAMTGEITLRGKVLPVGGIKEKILAAKRADIKEIILSKDNEKDILEIKQSYLKGLKFHYVERMSEVLDLALNKRIVKNLSA